MPSHELTFASNGRKLPVRRTHAITSRMLIVTALA